MADHATIDHTGLTGTGSALTVKEEGVALATAATSLDFVGAGVVASGTGAAKTITIAGGGGAAGSPFGDAVVALSGLVGYWRCNELFGTTIRDSSVNGHNMTLNSTTSRPAPGLAGKDASARSIDFAGGYADIAHNAAFNVANNLTVLAVVRCDTAAGDGVILGRSAFRLMRKGTAYDLQIPGVDDIALTASVVATDRPQFVAVTSSGTATRKVYVDGVDATNSSTATSIGTASSVLRIGSDTGGGTTFDGLIGEAALFDRALTSTEIGDLFALLNTYGVPA